MDKVNKIIKSESNILLPGPAGELEVLVSPELPIQAPLVALICHPHPLYGGTMHNKVVSTLARAFQQLGAATVRFNFRGVGKSKGSYGQGSGELEDLLAVMHWVKQDQPQAAIWFAGFSFGAYIAIRAAQEQNCSGLVTVAPPVNHFPLNNTTMITCPWLIVQGEQDEIVPAAEVLAWVEKLKPQPKLLRFPSAGHYFHGNLAELRETLLRELAEFCGLNPPT